MLDLTSCLSFLPVPCPLAPSVGGHGKGQWKNDELIYDDAVDPIDQNDPLYDEQEDAYVLSSHENPVTKNFDPSEGKAVYGPMLTQSEFKIQCTDALREYFDSCDADELIRSLEELQCKEFHPDVVKRAVSISLDKNSRERELVSRLLTCLHPNPLSDKDMEKGFNILLDSMDDLCTDVPEATVSLLIEFVSPVVRVFSSCSILGMNSSSSSSSSSSVIYALCIILTHRSTFIASPTHRRWLQTFWPGQWSMRYCHLHTFRSKTTPGQETL